MDLQQHLLRQMAFSHATYGPGKRMEGVLDHMAKEIEEVRESGGDPSEWVDLVMLALDGLTRQLAFSPDDNKRCLHPELIAIDVCRRIVEKQSTNEGREWPDWRTADPNKGIQHIEV